jgi:hypothetical protein
MSSLKYQLRAVFASLSTAAQGVTDGPTKERYYKLKRICLSPKDIARVCRSEGVSRGWFYKWGKRLRRSKNIISLQGESRRPKHSPRKTRKRIERKVCKIRRAQPYLGAERIQDDLLRLYKEKCAVSTINNILKRNDFIGKAKAQKLTKKHLGRINHPMPGYLQMDFKYVPYLIGGRQFYQLSCVDHLTSWRFIRSYPEKSTEYVMIFLKEMIGAVPFPALEIQTDNDAAFTDKYTSKLGRPTGCHQVDEWSFKNKILHKLIPLGEKELNGKVENTHKQDDREFFSQVRCLTERSLSINTMGYNDRWNRTRRTKRLRFKTPNETVWQSYVVMIAWLDGLMRRYRPEDKPLVQLDGNGDAYVEVKARKSRKKNRTHKRSNIRRYLDYLDWDDRNKAS